MKLQDASIISVILRDFNSTLGKRALEASTAEEVSAGKLKSTTFREIKIWNSY